MPLAFTLCEVEGVAMEVPLIVVPCQYTLSFPTILAVKDVEPQNVPVAGLTLTEAANGFTVIAPLTPLLTEGHGAEALTRQ